MSQHTPLPARRWELRRRHPHPLHHHRWGWGPGWHGCKHPRPHWRRTPSWSSWAPPRPRAARCTRHRGPSARFLDTCHSEWQQDAHMLWSWVFSPAGGVSNRHLAQPSGRLGERCLVRKACATNSHDLVSGSDDLASDVLWGAGMAARGMVSNSSAVGAQGSSSTATRDGPFQPKREAPRRRAAEQWSHCRKHMSPERLQARAIVVTCDG